MEFGFSSLFQANAIYYIFNFFSVFIKYFVFSFEMNHTPQIVVDGFLTSNLMVKAPEIYLGI